MSNQLQISGAAKIRTIQGPVVANSGVITALDGNASQYVRGDGTLADFPTSTGGGSSVSYYLNTSVSQGTIGGVAYKQLSKVPISGAGTDVTISANGYIASYITDANDPALLEVPAGNFNCEFYFSVNSNAHNPYVYAELYKYDGSTFTLLGSNQAIPEYLTNGTTLSAYYFAIPVAVAALTVTDRLAIRIYVNVDGRTVTLHTENNHLCQVVTTFSKGLISLNNLTRQNQFFATGTSGSDFNISSVTATHTFNIPDASASARGLITTGIQTIAGAKTFTGNIIADGSVLLKNNVTSFLAGYVNLGGIVTGYGFSVGLPNGGSPLINQLIFNSAAAYNYTFPAATGTIALTSNLSSYVPYTGATADVNLGTFSITGGIGTFTNGVLNGNGTNPANLYLKKGSSPFFTNAANYGLIAAVSSSFILISDVDGTNYKYASFNLGSLTNNTNRAYTLPDASGTLALTSNLSGYVPYTGATANVDLGGFDLSAYYINGKQLTIKKTGTAGGAVFIEQGTGAAFGGVSGLAIYAANTNQLSFSFIDATATNSKSIQLNFSSLTNNANRTYTLPDASGTLALTSNLSSYVPYTGATAQLDLGLNDLSARFIFAEGGGGIAPTLGFKQTSLGAVSTTNHTNIYVQNYNIIGFTFYQASAATKNFAFDVSGLDETTIRTYTMPNASGTLALTSSLSSYLPLTGGTLTGQLYINPTNTATVGLDVASNTTRFRSDNLEGFKRQLEITMGSGTLVQMVAKGFGANYGTDLAFYTATTGGVNATPAIYITSSNNVGIGNGTPNIQGYVGKVLTIGSSSTAENVLEIYGGVTGADDAVGQIDFINSYATGGGKRIAIIKSQRSGSNNSGDLNFFTLNAGSLASRMYISPAGNVGIGTSSPTAISGFTSVCVNNATSGGFFEAQQGGTVLSRYGAQNDISFIDTVANIPFIIKTNSTERMRIAANGKLTFNVTLAGDDIFNITNPSSTGYGASIQGGSSSGNYSLVVRGYTGSEYFKVRGDGWLVSPSTVNNSSGALGNLGIDGSGNIFKSTASSIRFKENITDWNDNGLDIILTLKPKIFTYKENYYSNPERQFLGLIAEDVAEVSNYLADFENEDGTGQVENVRYANIVVPLIKAIQELSAQNEDLKSRLDNAGL